MNLCGAELRRLPALQHATENTVACSDARGGSRRSFQPLNVGGVRGNEDDRPDGFSIQPSQRHFYRKRSTSEAIGTGNALAAAAGVLIVRLGRMITTGRTIRTLSHDRRHAVCRCGTVPTVREKSRSREDDRKNEDEPARKDGRYHPLRSSERPDHCHPGGHLGPSLKLQAILNTETQVPTKLDSVL